MKRTSFNESILYIYSIFINKLHLNYKDSMKINRINVAMKINDSLEKYVNRRR